VHLALIFHPLSGDLLYGGPGLRGLSRHFLDAARLGFAHPDGARARYERLLPPDLAAALGSLK